MSGLLVRLLPRVLKGFAIDPLNLLCQFLAHRYAPLQDTSLPSRNAFTGQPLAFTLFDVVILAMKGHAFFPSLFSLQNAEKDSLLNDLCFLNYCRIPITCSKVFVLMQGSFNRDNSAFCGLSRGGHNKVMSFFLRIAGSIL